MNWQTAMQGREEADMSSKFVVGLLASPNICHAWHKEAIAWRAMSVWLCTVVGLGAVEPGKSRGS
jgi:hypothetical protein